MKCPFREQFTCEDPDSQICLVCPNLKQFLKAALAAEEDRDELARIDGHSKDDE